MRIAFVQLCLVAAPCAAALAQPAVNLPLKGTLTRETRVVEVNLPSNPRPNMWELRLLLGDGTPSTGTLEALDKNPNSSANVVCFTAASSRCRFAAASLDAAARTVWVRVTAGNGEVEKTYQIVGLVPLAGASSFAEDVKEPLKSGSSGLIVTAGSGAASEHVYSLERAGGQPSLISVAAAADSGLVTVSLNATDGTLIAASHAPATQQLLVVPSGLTRAYVVIRADVIRPEQTLRYNTTVLGAEKDIASQVGRGYAARTTMNGDAYGKLLLLAGLEPGETSPDVGELHDIILRSLGLCTTAASPAEPACVPADVPLILFIGIGGNSRIVQLRKHGGDDPLSPFTTSLGQAREFWAAYIEDEVSPFDTSIDVQFRDRAARVDFESFNPVETPRLTTAARQQLVSRMVKIGVRRFRVRPPPVDAQVAFTRQGGAYGLRQWQRLYHVFGWSRWRVAIGPFIPAREVTVPWHTVNERDCVVVTCRPGEEALLVQDQLHRQLFVAASVQWPQVGARFLDDSGKWFRGRWLLLPNIIAGLGLPAERDNVYYLGAAWPFRGSFQATLGATFGKFQHVNEPYRVGIGLPVATPAEQTFDRRWTATFAAGVSFDVVRFP